jgi:hypothetical protein
MVKNAGLITGSGSRFAPAKGIRYEKSAEAEVGSGQRAQESGVRRIFLHAFSA